MPADWGRALQVGGVGFTMVFIILLILYLALWLMGRLGAKFSPANAKAEGKQAATEVEQKGAPVSSG